MGKKLDRSGIFMAYAVSSGTKLGGANKLPMFVAQFEVVQEWDAEQKTMVDVTGVEECEVRGNFCLAGKDKQVFSSVKQIAAAYAWKGSISELNSTDYSEVPVIIVVKDDTYKDKPVLSVEGIYNADTDPESIGGVGKMTDADTANLDLVYSSVFKAELGGDKPLAAKPKNKPKGKPGTPPKTKAKDDGEDANAAAKEAAKAAVEEKKQRAATAEDKSKPPSKRAKPVVPKRGKPPATAKTEVAEEAEAEEASEALVIPPNCSQEDAWELVEQNLPEADAKAIEDEWVKTVKDLGDDEAVASTPDGWGNVAQIVITQLS